MADKGVDPLIPDLMRVRRHRAIRVMRPAAYVRLGREGLIHSAAIGYAAAGVGFSSGKMIGSRPSIIASKPAQLIAPSFDRS
jgi:hypothetical protein